MKKLSQQKAFHGIFTKKTKSFQPDNPTSVVVEGRKKIIWFTPYAFSSISIIISYHISRPHIFFCSLLLQSQNLIKLLAVENSPTHNAGIGMWYDEWSGREETLNFFLQWQWLTRLKVGNLEGVLIKFQWNLGISKNFKNSRFGINLQPYGKIRSKIWKCNEKISTFGTNIEIFVENGFVESGFVLQKYFQNLVLY